MIGRIKSIAGKVAFFSGLALMGALAEAQAVTRFSLPAQPMADSLRAVGTQTNTNVLFDPALVAAMTAPELKAELTRNQALARLLSGTGLKYELLSERTAIVAPVRVTVAPAYTRTALSALPDVRLAQMESSSASTSSSAEAQVDPTSSPADSAVTEVIVSAQKRDELLIDVPQSVSVLSADSLAKLGVRQFRDFANTVPGLSFTTAGAGFTQVSLRGVTAGTDISPTVGIYVDEIPYGSSSAFTGAGRLALDVGLFDIDRIEVLRGPQGTLYGASTMGGLIKYVSKLPSSKQFGGEAQAGISGTEQGGVSYNVAGAVNAPIVEDKVALRASAFQSHDGGFIDNVTLGRDDLNRSDIYGGRVDLLLTPSDALSVRLNGFAQNISRDGQSTVDYSFAGTPQSGSSLAQSRGFSEPFDQEFRLFSATVGYDFGPAALTSISSYQTGDTEFYTDSRQFVSILRTVFNRSYSAVAVNSALSIDKFVQEIRFASQNGRPIEWVLGGFYTHEDSQTAEQFALLDSAGQPALNDLYKFTSPSKYEEYAGFGDITWYLAEKFDVSAGLRYAHNDQSFEQIASGVLIASTPERSADEEVVTYLANARYQFTDHQTAYLRYATGYRPGGPNFVANNPVTGAPLGPLVFDADRLKSYEAGLRTETEDRSYAADVSMYYIDWNNIQIASSAGGFAFRANAPGGATVKGTELSLTAHPIDEIVLTGAFAYQDAQMSAADPTLRAAKGERLPNVPRFTAAVSGDYEMLGGDLRPALGATVRYVADRYASFNASVSNPQYRLPEYTVVDLRAGFALGSVNAQLYIHNLLNERGELSTQTNRGRSQSAILQPRTLGISFTTHF